MKCLPTAKISTANGNILHDWHAEVLAMRAFNHWLLQECQKLSCNEGADSSILIRRDDDGHGSGNDLPFSIRPSIRIFMYCSEAPCGDASMELVMQRQEDSTPWPLPQSSELHTHLHGRECFSELGVVRGKPGRDDVDHKSPQIDSL